jgi:hypothetical protein
MTRVSLSLTLLYSLLAGFGGFVFNRVTLFSPEHKPPTGGFFVFEIRMGG